MTSTLAQVRALLTGPDACSDRLARPKPPTPLLGGAGFHFNDPTFGSRMLRVTDATMGGTSWRCPSTAVQAAWNADSTRFYVMSGNGTVQTFTFDPDAMVATLAPDVPYSQVEPQFSRVDPDGLYVVGGPQTRTIRRYSFKAKATVDVLDLDTLGLPNLMDPRTYVGGITTSGGDEAFMAFFGGTGQDRHFWVTWQRRNAPASSRLLLDTRPLGFNLHSAAMDLSGRYVILYPTNAQPYQVVVWDTTTNTTTPVTASPTGHGAFGYGDWVNADSNALPYDAAQWQYRKLNALASPLDVINPVMRPTMVYWADHTTWNNARPDIATPVISSTYRYGNNPVPWRAWDDEVIAIDHTTGIVYRFCHHRSDVRLEGDPTSLYFWYEPIANVSPDGKWILFTSNWEKTLGTDPQDPSRSRQDVFMVKAL